MKIFTKNLNIVVAVLCLLVWTGSGFAQQKVSPGLSRKAQAEGAIQVIVELTVPWRSDVKLHSSEMLTQNKAIAAAQNQLLAELAETHYKIVRRLEHIPVIALEVNFYGLTLLSNSDIVTMVTENQTERLQRLERVPFMN